MFLAFDSAISLLGINHKVMLAKTQMLIFAALFNNERKKIIYKWFKTNSKFPYFIFYFLSLLIFLWLLVPFFPSPSSPKIGQTARIIKQLFKKML